MSGINIKVVDENNVVVNVTPPARQTIALQTPPAIKLTIDRGLYGSSGFSGSRYIAFCFPLPFRRTR
jgi:hypothetical protein